MTQWARLEWSKLAVSLRYSEPPTSHGVRGFQTYCSGLVGRQQDLLWDPQQITASPLSMSEVGKTGGALCLSIFIVFAEFSQCTDTNGREKHDILTDWFNCTRMCFKLLQVNRFANIICSFCKTWLYTKFQSRSRHITPDESLDCDLVTSSSTWIRACGISRIICGGMHWHRMAR